MTKPTVFLSRITEEAKLAQKLRDHIAKDFLDMIGVFVSSDHESISVGSKWLNDVGEALKIAQVELILCSFDSVKRPWINFEAGAGWVKGIPVVPVCHTGMRPADLPIPLNMLQAIEAHDKVGLQKLYVVIAKQLNSAVPTANYDQIVSEVNQFEYEYGVVRDVSVAVRALMELLPKLEQIFRPKPLEKAAAGDIPDLTLDKMRPHLKSLQSRRMIDYTIGANKTVFSTTGGGGNMIELEIQVQESYYKIAGQVISNGV